ncbi:MAG: hypothetical protein DMG76_31475 [Acidobacteria bacterium]|nr:MAG: hypothetical protein DMG76_31475 [Acidobacteriota bacterium]
MEALQPLPQLLDLPGLCQFVVGLAQLGLERLELRIALGGRAARGLVLELGHHPLQAALWAHDRILRLLR